jgi:hypothetical protein
LDEDLWKRVQAAFHYARSRERAIAEADRIFRKSFPEFPMNYISEAACDIRFERLSREMLSDLELRSTMDRPQFGTGTIIIVEHLGKRYVVDGTKRVNRWKFHNISETDQAVIISRRS